MNERQAILQANLGEYLQQVSGGPAGVSHMQPLAGGASRETWAVTANLAGREEHLVLRLDMASSMNAAAISRADEFRLLQVAYEQGVRCPRPRWLCTDPAVLGAPFFLMDLVAGESIGTRVVRRPELATARAALPAQMAAQLAHIHAIDPATPALAFLPRPPAGTSPAQHIINQMRQALVDLQSASPGLTAGLRWLEQHQPPAGALRVMAIFGWAICWLSRPGWRPLSTGSSPTWVTRWRISPGRWCATGVLARATCAWAASATPNPTWQLMRR